MNPYTYAFDVYTDARADQGNTRERGPFGEGPVVGARTPRGRAEEAAYQAGTIGGTGNVPWVWIGAGVLALFLIARR
jgi:hypothetical protein